MGPECSVIAFSVTISESSTTVFLNVVGPGVTSRKSEEYRFSSKTRQVNYSRIRFWRISEKIDRVYVHQNRYTKVSYYRVSQMTRNSFVSLKSIATFCRTRCAKYRFATEIISFGLFR